MAARLLLRLLLLLLLQVGKRKHGRRKLPIAHRIQPSKTVPRHAPHGARVDPEQVVAVHDGLFHRPNIMGEGPRLQVVGAAPPCQVGRVSAGRPNPPLFVHVRPVAAPARTVPERLAAVARLRDHIRGRGDVQQHVGCEPLVVLHDKRSDAVKLELGRVLVGRPTLRDARGVVRSHHGRRVEPGLAALGQLRAVEAAQV